MENADALKPGHESTEPVILKVTEDIRSYLYETAKWTRFLSIVGFVICALIIIFAFSVPAILSAVAVRMPANPLARVSSGLFTIPYLLIGLLYFYPSLLLFKFANAAKTAVLYNDQPAFSIAIGKMKSFFKFWGILTIIAIALNLLLFLFMVVAGIGVASAA